MSGSEFIKICPKCGEKHELRGKALTRALTCKKCNVYFRVGQGNSSTVEFHHAEPQALPIGAKGRVDDYLYEVMGFVVKQETKYHYTWREYLVFNPFRGYAFLSEYNGHWNFVWPVESDPRTDSSGDSFLSEGNDYQLYQRYTAQVVQARGEFFFDVFDLTASTMNYEYISPPYLYALEKNDDSVIWCKGEYFSREDIAEAFSVDKSTLPSKEGVGYTQPFKSAFSAQSLIAITVFLVLLTFVLQLFINNSAKEKVVFHADYTTLDVKDQKMIVTPSFELEGTRSLEVYLSAPLSDDWFFGEFSLINETDGSEYNFSKEIEYYSGVEDGYQWSEGSRHGEAFLSQIPAGKYHLNIYPEFSAKNSAFSIVVTHDVPMYVNFFVTSLALIAFPAFFFIRKNLREKARWSDSEYSPYHYE